MGEGGKDGDVKQRKQRKKRDCRSWSVGEPEEIGEEEQILF